MSEDCLFCRIVSGEIESDSVEETERWIALRDVNPQAPTHVLIVPREHVAVVNDLTAEHDSLLGEMIRGAARIAGREGIAESGYRLVINCNAGAGQSVFHLHLHLLGGRSMRWPPG